MKNSRVLFYGTLVAAVLLGTGGFFLASRDSVRSSDLPAGVVPAKKEARAMAASVATAKLISKAQAPLFFTLSAKLPKPLQTPLPVGVNPKTLPTPNEVLSTTVLNPASLPNLAALKKGQIIGIPLPDGRSFDGLVGTVQPAANGVTRVGGTLMPGKAGTFTIGQQGAKMAGMIRLPAENLSYVIETRADGQILLQEQRLTDLECVGMPTNPAEPAPAAAAVSVNDKAEAATTPIPDFDSIPGSIAVIYIDFDGEPVDDPSWNPDNGNNPINAAAPLYNGAPLTASHITQVCQSVAEDYAPFNISVTNIRSRYDNAPVGARMRCIVTPTNFEGPGVGGIAQLNSFSQAGTIGVKDDIPCWCFGIYEPASMALVISHEVGHTFGLHHDGLTSPSQAYYSGYGTGPTSWGPIMGNPYGRTMTQWSQGDYAYANQLEDDIAIIANLTNGIGFVADDGGADIAHGTPYNSPNGSVSLKGIISSSADVDVYKILVATAPLTITCTPSAALPNLDVSLALFDSTSTLVGSVSAPTDSLAATVSAVTALSPGYYYLLVRGSGNGAAYSTYGSVGAYTLSGSYVTNPSVPVFTLQPLPATLIEGASVTLTAQAITTGGIAYQWWFQSTGGAYVALTGAGTQTNTLKLTAIKPAQQGLYKLLATNTTQPSFFKFSDEVLVTVNTKPKILSQPAAFTAAAGTDHTFTVNASGTAPLLYTWERNNLPIPGFPQSISPDLALTNITLDNAGNYRVKVTNATGTVVTSSAVALKVNSPPVISLQPVSSSAIPPGGSTTLKVAAVGNSPFTYQWYKVGLGAIDKAKAATLAVKEAGTYYVKVFNAIGGAVGTQSNDAVVDVEAKPVITGQPIAPATIPTGGVTRVDLTVTATGGGTLFYQWQKDGKNILLTENPTAHDATLTYDPISWTNRGSFKVIVTNRVGSVSSKAVTIAVNGSPIIITQPLNPTSGATNGTAVFSVVAGGNAPLTYQWYVNDLANPIDKATTAKLSLSKLTLANDGNRYFCRVSNTQPGGPAETIHAKLLVEDLPKITAITSDKAANHHKVVVNGSIKLSATITGNVATYQWLKAGKPIAGATNPTLTLFPASLSDTASYSLLITNSVGKATSAALAIAVLLPPAINVIPSDATVVEESPVTFSIKASGSPTLKYQWERYNSVTSSWDNMVGKTAASLAIAKAAFNDAGSYRCTVTNEVGSATSFAAQLSVLQVQPATITNFYPKSGQAGDLVRLTGTNLQYLAFAKFGTYFAAITPVSDTEILLTVPKCPTTGVMISLTSKGSAASYVEMGTYNRTTDFANSQLSNAQIVTGSAFTLDASLTSFAIPRYGYFWWKAPRTGQFKFQVAANFDSTIEIWAGSPGTGYETYIGYEDYLYYGSTYEYITFTATQNQSYLIIVGAYFNTAYISGTYRLLLTQPGAIPVADSDFEPTAGFTANSPLVGQKGWVAQGDGRVSAASITTNAEGNNAVRLGGNGTPNAKPVLLAQSTGATSTDGDVVASFRMGLEQPPMGVSHDWFNWTLYGTEGQSLGSLQVNAEDGSLYTTTADGTQTLLVQKLTLGIAHNFEMVLDQSAETWEATMDGVTIASGLKLPAGGSFKEICPAWLPSTDGAPHATLVFDNIRVNAKPQ